MKLVVGIIRPEKLAAVQRALRKRDLSQMTVSHVFGGGHERGHSYIYRSVTIEESLIPRLKLEVAIDDHEGWRIALAQQRQALKQRAPTDPTDEITDEQDASMTGARAGVDAAGSGRRLLRGRRLGLSHTLAMVAGK